MVKIRDIAVVSTFIISSFFHGRKQKMTMNKPIEKK